MSEMPEGTRLLARPSLGRLVARGFLVGILSGFAATLIYLILR